MTPSWQKEYFRIGSSLDDGDDAQALEERRPASVSPGAGAGAPYFVRRLDSTFANIHYASAMTLVEAQALYERGDRPGERLLRGALSNLVHTSITILGRYPEAQACYREALRLNSYLRRCAFLPRRGAVSREMGLSQEARPHCAPISSSHRQW
jgi:hypothetical protein